MAIDPVSLAITAALTAASMAMTALQRIKGPRLDDLEVSLGDYGAPIPRLWGRRKFQPQYMWAEKLHEKESTQKTKGGKFENFEYFGTWANLITDSEINGFMRIWMDKHLVYQSTDAGPVAPVLGLIDGPFGMEIKLGFSTNLRFYFGTEDQLPDARIQAWCEDRYGPDSCPAYRGSAYLVFEEIPLEKFGNRIPQITVEVTRASLPAYIYETKTNAGSGVNGVFSLDFSRYIQLDGNLAFVWDVPNRILMAPVALPTTLDSDMALAPDRIYGRAGGFTPASSELWEFSDDMTGGTLLLTGFDGYAGGCRYAGGKILFYPPDINEDYYLVFTGAAVVPVVIGFAPTHFCTGPLGDAYAIGTTAGGVGLYIARCAGIPFGGMIVGGGNGSAWGMLNPDGNFLVYQGGSLYLIDGEDLSLIDSVSIGASDTYAKLAMDATPPQAGRIWIGYTEYDTRTMETIRVLDPDDWFTGDIPTGAVYDPVNHAILSHAIATNDLTWRYVDRIGDQGVTLATVVDEISQWVGVDDVDTTDLTQLVYGYSVTQGTAKDMINPLLELHDVDARPHDFSVQFVNRGSAPSGTILTGDFASDGEDRYKVTIQQDTDLPKRVTFTYADAEKDQQANTAIAQRPLDVMDSDREESIDLSTYAEYPPAAQQMADRYLRRLWNSREGIENSLTAEHLAIEPADVKTISLDGVLRNVKLRKMTLRGMAIDCEFVRDETAFAVLNDSEGAPMDGRDPEVIFIPGATKGFVLDIPLIDDSDNDINPVIYLGAGKYTGSWPGAVVFRGDDGTYDENYGSVEPSAGSIWGIGSDTLPTSNPGLWDRGSELNLQVFGGTLTSVSEADIDADPALNLCAVGNTGRWELLQFANATLEMDGTYTLSDFKRGRRGTEWAIDLHQSSDIMVMVDNMMPVEMGLGDVGDAISFKIQTVGRPVVTGMTSSLTYTGASLKPYAPASLHWYFDGTDLQGTIVRRTRIGGNWNGAIIPLGEASEAYEVDAYNGSTFKRTISVSGTNVFTYTAAMATADGITLPTPPTTNTYQMSATVGRGFAAIN